MASQLESESPAVSSLVGGIVEDARQLLIQQLTLFQVEIKNDFRRTLAVCVPMFVGACVLFVAAIVLSIGLAYLFCWIWPELPVWGGFGIVGGGLAIAGAALILWGKEKFATSSLLPNESVEGLKENIQWKTKK